MMNSAKEFPRNAKKKKNLGTKRNINFGDEALYLEKMKIKHMEERLLKNSKATKTTCA